MGYYKKMCVKCRGHVYSMRVVCGCVLDVLDMLVSDMLFMAACPFQTFFTYFHVR